jgi:hypothetical protein
MKVVVNDEVRGLPIEELADAVRASYRDAVHQAIAQGHARPLVLPYNLLAPFLVPALWLTLPHVQRPWLYRLRWAIVALVAAFTADVLYFSTSANTAFAYIVGPLAFWGLISTMHLLIWTRPQFEAARIVKRRKERREEAGNKERTDEDVIEVRQDQHGNALRQRRLQGAAPVCMPSTNEPSLVPAAKEEYEYVWQPFPAESPLRERLNWALDLTTNFRLAGEFPTGLYGFLPFYTDPSNRRLELRRLRFAAAQVRCRRCADARHAS